VTSDELQAMQALRLAAAAYAAYAAAAETSLAAATELLRRAHDTLARLGLQWVDAPVPLIGDLRAFLAAQPAAPARPHCDDHAGWRSDCDRCAMYEPPAAPARTEAEQRVLDACPGISRAALNRWQHRQSGLGVFAKAELARRGV
jgi:hypothetical protein